MRSGLWIVGGVLLVASGIAHAFAGWPPLRAALESQGCDRDLIGALGAGWAFGSVSMLTFGVLVLADGLRARRSVGAGALSAPAIAAAYVGFGAVAWFLRDLNPHFLGFVALGTWVGLPCLRRRSSARDPGPVTRP